MFNFVDDVDYKEGEAYVTIEYVKNHDNILDDFVNDIKYLETNHLKCRYSFGDAVRPGKIHRADGKRFPSGREYWTHNHRDYPILLEKRPCLVKLPDNLFEV